MSHDFTNLVDLASERLGARVVAASDEFFAPKERLTLVEAPIWPEDADLTDNGPVSRALDALNQVQTGEFCRAVRDS